jgi:hypothetical protein
MLYHLVFVISSTYLASGFIEFMVLIDILDGFHIMLVAPVGILSAYKVGIL